MLTALHHLARMATSISVRQIRLPVVSYGPFRFLEVVPWLMFAAAMRLVAYRGGAPALPALILANFALFLAILLVARRMIEFTDGRTGLGRFNFGEQLRLACRILGRVVLLLLAMWLIVALLGARDLAPYFLVGFDGIAFDQRSRTGMVWSSVLAAIVLLMVVKAGDCGSVTLSGTLRELAARSAWLVPAIVAVAAAQMVLSFGQGLVRVEVHHFLRASPAPVNLKNFIYFAFIFGFATIRLWVTMAVLTFALRESYRRVQSDRDRGQPA